VSSRLDIRDRTGRLLRRFRLPADSAFPKWSRDGSQLAFETDYYNDGGDIEVLNLASGRIRNLTRGGGVNNVVAWTGDGRLLILRAPSLLGQHSLWSVNSDGSRLRKIRLPLAKVNPFRADLSPDGRTLVLSMDNGIFSMDLDGTGLRQLTHDLDTGYWSPDGRLIAFEREPGGDPPTDVWVMNADGSHQHQVTHSDENNQNDVGKTFEGWRCGSR